MSTSAADYVENGQFVDSDESFSVEASESKRFKSSMTEIEEVRKEIGGVKSGLEKLLTKMNTVCEKMVSLDKRFEAVEETVKKQGDEVRELKEGMVMMEKKMGVMEDRMRRMEEKRMVEIDERMLRMEDKAIDQEARSRRNNLVLHGVEEREGETTEQCRKVLENLIKDRMGIKDKVTIERAHRLGQRPPPGRKPAKPRPLIARFLDFNDRERVRDARRQLPKTIRVSEDLPWQIRQARTQLSAALDEAKKKSANSWIAYPARLLVDGKEVDYIRPSTMVQSADGRRSRGRPSGSAPRV